MTSHFSHALSVFVLYQLSRLISVKAPPSQSSKFALLAASLHIISPAGIFLSATYAEATFALLNFTGMFIYALSLEYHEKNNHGLRDLMILASGLTFGIATSLRTNGLLSGSLFLYDAVEPVLQLLRFKRLKENLRRLCFNIVAGFLTAMGSLIPQYLAYRVYCIDTPLQNRRSWCDHSIPSVYGWVQNHYWYVSAYLIPVQAYAHKGRNVGFLHYWTASNVPLFLLAAPMLYILTASALWGISHKKAFRDAQSFRHNSSHRGVDQDLMGLFSWEVVSRFVVPQAILAILAVTTYHVQIITRISSAYPVWYWWLASSIIQKRTVSPASDDLASRRITRWMVVYSLVQGGLFSSFLPPA